MSLDFIIHTLTTQTIDEVGVITWTNPKVSVKINSKGEVLGKKGVKKPSINGAYSIVLKGALSGNNKPWQASFNSLYSRMVLGIRLQGSTITLKDVAKGYVGSNVKVISLTEVSKCQVGRWQGHTRLTKKVDTIPEEESTPLTPIPLPTPNTTSFTQWGVRPERKYYSVYTSKDEYHTEDGAIFPTKALARWHQEKVDKGKGNAQVVLDYNGGYILAEQIYLQEVIYNKDKPYKNFIDVLNNNRGVVEVQEVAYRFDNLGSVGTLNPLIASILPDLDKLTCNKEQAEEVNRQVNLVVKSFQHATTEREALAKLILTCQNEVKSHEVKGYKKARCDFQQLPVGVVK